jgi:hypothetical protein
MRQKPISPEVMVELRMMIETIAMQAVERALAQAGEISFAKIGNSQGEVEVADDKRDAWAHTTDLVTEHKRMPRLYTPAGILFNQPAKDETVHILRAKDCGGPGGELAIPDGGDGSPDHLPEWYAEKAGISVDGKVAVLESRTDDVEVTSGDGKIVNIQAGDKGVARKDDEIHAGWLLVTPGIPPASATVVAYQPYGPVPPPPAPPQVIIPLAGKITSASTKAKCG